MYSQFIPTLTTSTGNNNDSGVNANGSISFAPRLVQEFVKVRKCI